MSPKLIFVIVSIFCFSGDEHLKVSASVSHFTMSISGNKKKTPVSNNLLYISAEDEGRDATTPF